ncbi:antibiotic biosynthesis monooxygenase [Nocardioides sp.]|uniref:antibiotic biosynthesis monooxygenase n=1 Tax=Nocardioides sp. TaxID=35761 RepID=UPI000C93635D|nr:antibiotic biosynthesis monooxygenase [Nocardioides sp.]MAS56685.1 antibiotic biosynthesis monooxygenase [Pimelobacter sp.]MDE0776448.1 antibiotic biosynthesis monooxygenase [Nocardioides sp.]
MSDPVTVAITRQLEPGHEAEMMSWLNAGIHLAERFPGFLGAGWVRPEAGSTEWHMLYRFADHDSLQQWEHSSQRAWWRASASGLGVVEARVEKRTGIEGWFDVPQSTLVVEGAAPAPAPPPRWKQACTIFLVFFPLSVAANWLGGQLVGDLFLPLRVLLTVLVMTPVMTYVALPWITRTMQWWLQGQPAPWRRDPEAASAS